MGLRKRGSIKRLGVTFSSRLLAGRPGPDVALDFAQGVARPQMGLKINFFLHGFPPIGPERLSPIDSSGNRFALKS
jgi:hypothetical protein